MGRGLEASEIILLHALVETVVPKPAPAATAYDSPAMVSAPKKFVLDVPEVLPDKFSEGFSPLQFAEWMKGKKFLPDEDCEVIIGKAAVWYVVYQIKNYDIQNIAEYDYLKLESILLLLQH